MSGSSRCRRRSSGSEARARARDDDRRVADDWDRYETLHWLAGEEWLHKHPDDPDAAEIRARIERHRERYLRWGRDLLGWTIVAGRKR
ncbi:MAG: hypothetical protein H0W14_08350 [Actinobacteria bacterium]|nr:hypothetical protein [Actinomycetota bacterium]